MNGLSTTVLYADIGGLVDWKPLSWWFYFRKYEYVYEHFSTFLNMDMTPVVEIIPCGKQGHVNFKTFQITDKSNVCSVKLEWRSVYRCEMLLAMLPTRPRNFGNMMTASNGNIFRVTGHLCGEFTGPRWIPTQRPVTRSFDVYFDLRPNKRLSKQSWGWWFETPLHPLWRHRNDSADASAAIRRL